MSRYEELKQALTIDKNSLDRELIHQAALFNAVGEEWVQAVDKRDALKEFLGLIEAEIENEVRQEASDNKEKITNDEVKSRVRVHPDRRKASGNYGQAKKEADKLDVLKNAYLQRASMLKRLCELYIANYYEQNSVRVGARQDSVVYQQQRAKIAAHGRANGK